MAIAAPGLPTPPAIEPAPVSAEPSPVKEDSLAVLKALAEASAVFVALTFIGGWSYLASYYRTFGLNPLELDISIPVVSTIAVYVLYESVWPLIVAGVLIVGFAIFAQRLRRFGRGAVVGLVVVLLLTTATAGAFHGREVAMQDTLPDSATLPNVAFAAKLKDLDTPCVDFETYGSLDCKLLLHFKDTYYFFEPVPKDGIGNNMHLYMLSDSDVLGVHVQRGLDRTARIE